MPDCLIITNGDIVAARLIEAGVDADVLPWRDTLHDGPVPGGLVLEALSLVRAAYLSRRFQVPLPILNAQFAERDRHVRSHGQYGTVELWFEHDLYDQLQLIQILDFFIREGRTDALSLVHSGVYLAELSRDQLLALFGSAQRASAAELDLAQGVWRAFTDPTPRKLDTIPLASPLPHLAPALQRLVQELPAVGSGLSLTEERLLTALLSGSRPVVELFGLTQAQEKARFLGDMSFYRLAADLAQAPKPLVEVVQIGGGKRILPAAIATSPDTKLRITETGRIAVAGRFDHARENGIDRWFGGTHLTPDSLWRRDKAGMIVAPAPQPVA